MLKGQCLVLALVTTLLTTAACSGGGSESRAQWVAERDTVGDTVVVRTVTGSLWGKPRGVREVLRIGVLDGPKELMLGSVDQIAVDAAGGIYVFDEYVPALRYYDAAGRYVRTLGREGSGPGEYRKLCWGMDVRGDGKVVLQDFRNNRLNVYAPDGTPYAHWMISGAGPWGGNHGLVVDTADHVYVPILTGIFDPSKPLPLKTGYLHLDAEGATVDTVHLPSLPNEPDQRTANSALFGPSKVQAFSPLGYLVVGLNDDYSFDVRRPDGPVMRIEREYEPVEYLPEERAEWEALLDWWKARRPNIDLPQPPPAHKVPFKRIQVAEDGRIWVQLSTVAWHDQVAPPEDPDEPPPLTWREPAAYDVFEPDGTYLGRVDLPLDSRGFFMQGDTVWAVRTGELDEEYVVKLVIADETT